MIKLKSILFEGSKKQKEFKKDTLLKKAHIKSSNKVPSFEKVWRDIQMSDGYKAEVDYIRNDHQHKIDDDEIDAIIRGEQLNRYEDILLDYKYLDGKPCWREIVIPRTLDPRKLNPLGVYWAIVDTAAEAHWGEHIGEPHFTCVYEANIDLDVVDWPGTIHARMDMSIGDLEQEIRFLPGSTIFVKYVIVDDNVTDQKITHQINAERQV
jgi:hypothetical protein